MPFTKFSCHNCPDRHIACSDKCEKYQIVIAEIKKAKEKKAKFNEGFYYQIHQAYRSKQRAAYGYQRKY